ncbi:6488_t:CDS:2 [Cetraspora pellucida]|uniref:6488_t:CDS:1 n=1 Tax=Cetraspora pellucida TaxID=1433469 RepID=A0ACA9MKT0_9GLOM|nr:6488_t:CDS:2 [Cetraspora pellucida]
MSSLQEWFNVAVNEKEFDEIRYDDLKELVFIARGAFGEVYSANCVSTKNTVAPSNSLMDLFMLIKHILDPNDGSYLIVMEYADSGNLQQFLSGEKNNLRWIEKLSLARQLAEGIAYIHSKDILHRDLHGKNILVHQRQIKIADFGLSKNLNSTLTSKSSLLGILPYIEPMAIANHRYKKDKRSDVYSVGVLLWELSSCRPPFDSLRDQTAVYTCILQGAREAPISNTPIKYMELYKRCWDTEPDLRPNINEIVVRLSTIRLEPVYNPPAQIPVNSGSLNTLLSSISSGNNPTLIFDENLAVPLKLNDEIPPDYGTCKSGHKFTDFEWCNECESENFRRNFNSWTSGDQRLDELIKESQLKATHVSDYIEWIEHDQLKDIERNGQGGFSTVYSAIWRDGPREEWDEETGQWERAFNTKVVIKYLAESELDTSIVLNEIIPCYGISRNNITGTYGLVQKFASYGSLRSFINGRSFIGWWQKLKILEGIIQGLSQIHLKASYCHRDLHSGNVLIDQDELSVSVNEGQFNSADRKVRGLKKRRRTKKMEIKHIYASNILTLSNLMHQDVKYISTEYNFDKENLVVASKEIDTIFV